MSTNDLASPEPPQASPAGPFDRYTFAAAAALSAILLWEARLPGFYYLKIIFFLGALWASLCGLVAVRLVLAGLTGREVPSTGWRGVLLLPAIATALVAFKAPLHLGFAFARPTFDHVIEHDLQPGESFPISRASAGVYSFFQEARRRCRHDPDRIYFRLSNDKEAGFVYSTSGIDDLCYNSGSKGHLSGNWYWMAED